MGNAIKPCLLFAIRIANAIKTYFVVRIPAHADGKCNKTNVVLCLFRNIRMANVIKPMLLLLSGCKRNKTIFVCFIRAYSDGKRYKTHVFFFVYCDGKRYTTKAIWCVCVCCDGTRYKTQFFLFIAMADVIKLLLLIL